MTFELGRRPEYLRVILIPGSPLIFEIYGEDPNTPFVQIPKLHFSGLDVVWTATLVDALTARWEVPAEEVDAVIAASPDRRARLLLGPHVWAEGKFEVDRD